MVFNSLRRRVLVTASIELLVVVTCLPAAWADERTVSTTSGPWNMEALRRAPNILAAEEGPTLTSVYYEGEAYQGKPTRVFAYLARPEKQAAPQKWPAMILVHGGGGTAFGEWAELWAKRGYVALAMDLVGQGPGRKRLSNGGPPQDNRSNFGDIPIHESWSFHAVAAVVRGISLVASLPEVDSEKMGITGISWGGYLTCMAPATGKLIAELLGEEAPHLDLAPYSVKRF